MMEIKETATLIAGGASGMGEATVRHLSALGAKIAILDPNESRAAKIAAETKSIALACDVTDEKSVLAAIKNAEKTHGIARICINCAGIVQSKRMVGRDGPLPLNDFEKIIRVNLMGTFNLMRLASTAMSQSQPDSNSNRGLIINTASIAAFEGQIGQVAYSASKGGVVAMTLPAARELARFGIRVMTIAPGLVDTPMFDALPEEARQKLAASVPFPKRLATPQEFAKLVQHVIENDMLNGSVIRLDGALRLDVS